MRIVDLLIFVLLIVLLGIGVYLWMGFPFKTIEYSRFSANISAPEKSVQFFPSMRYEDREISYYIEERCDMEKSKDARDAFSILSDKTILSFYEVGQEPEIRIFCSEIAPEPEEEGHFVAGEGGPSEVINASIYSVIFSGKVSLFRADDCIEPQIAVHEILHALGFDHNNNKNSIMYPITSCEQIIDEYIIEEINSLYRVNSAPDLLIESVNANKSGRYLNFDITVANLGLKRSMDSSLRIFSNGGEVKNFDLGELEVGTRKVLSVQNLRLGWRGDEISFAVETDEDEISNENNAVKLTIT
jgi:hypothetical protein